LTRAYIGFIAGEIRDGRIVGVQGKPPYTTAIISHCQFTGYRTTVEDHEVCDIGNTGQVIRDIGPAGGRNIFSKYFIPGAYVNGFIELKSSW